MSAVLPVPATDLIRGVTLTRGERLLFEQLDIADGALVSKETLVEATGSTVRTRCSNPQEVLVARLRRKLESGNVPLRIETQRSRGYRLVRTGGEA